jgi:hypothetical protein
VVVLITCLSIKLAAEKLFGINNIQFKGGLCSDHSSSFVNAFKEVFPTTQPIQCYSHIIRKFIDPIQSNRKENGTYRRHLQNARSNQQFFIYNEAMKDVSNLHDCQTKQMRDRYLELVMDAWSAQRLRITFRPYVGIMACSCSFLCANRFESRDRKDSSCAKAQI